MSLSLIDALVLFAGVTEGTLRQHNEIANSMKEINHVMTMEKQELVELTTQLQAEINSLKRGGSLRSTGKPR